MIKLNAGNVLLKPSHRRQIMGSLKRCQRLLERLGKSLLTITMHRAGRLYELRADVVGGRGNFNCRVRQNDWRTACRELVRRVTTHIHDVILGRALA